MEKGKPVIVKFVAWCSKKALKGEEIFSFQSCEHQIADDWSQKAFGVTELRICGDSQFGKAVEFLPLLH